MEQEKIKELSEKIKNGTSTKEEELELLKLLNNGIESFRAFIKDIMVDKKES